MTSHSEHHELGVVVNRAVPETFSQEHVDRLLRHADECPECAARFHELVARAIMAQPGKAELGAERRDRLRERVLSAIRDQPQGQGTAPSRTSHRTLSRAGGWLAAAGLSGALLTHHSFHEPLTSGWLAAAAFGVLALGLGLYSRALKQRVAELEQGGAGRDGAPPRRQR